MAKTFAILGMLIGFCLLLVFALDLAVALPFGKVSTTMDVAMIICAVVLTFLSFRTFREIR